MQGCYNCMKKNVCVKNTGVVLGICLDYIQEPENINCRSILYTYHEPESTLPKKVIQNDKATILIWEDGTKTIVKCSEDDIFNKQHGFLAAYFEKHSGLTKTQISKYMNKVLECE